jgi:hypothetical protein
MQPLPLQPEGDLPISAYVLVSLIAFVSIVVLAGILILIATRWGPD